MMMARMRQPGRRNQLVERGASRSGMRVVMTCRLQRVGRRRLWNGIPQPSPQAPVHRQSAGAPKLPDVRLVRNDGYPSIPFEHSKSGPRCRPRSGHAVRSSTAALQGRQFRREPGRRRAG